MSGLPNHHLAVIGEDKVVSYLLAESHPAGRSKALFFRRLGFDATSLRVALLDHARTGRVTSAIETAFGWKYIVDGEMLAPNGKALVRSVWFVETGEAAPRLVTAYPGQGGRDDQGA